MILQTAPVRFREEGAWRTCKDDAPEARPGRRTSSPSRQSLRSMTLHTLVSVFYLVLVGIVVQRRARCDERSFLHVVLVYAPGVAWMGPLAWLVPTALAQGDLSAVILNAITAGLVIFVLMDLRLGTPPRLHPAQKRIRVATFNVFGGSIDIEKCVAFLRSCEADVIFLQEAWWTFHDRRVDSRPCILRTFAEWHVFASADEDEMMILSRHPLSDVQERRVGTRPCLVATMQSPVGDVRLVNVHLDPPATPRSLKRSGKSVIQFFLDSAVARRQQGDALRSLVEESPAPTILAGDFNSPPHAYARRVLRPLLRDVFGSVGRGFGYTYPVPVPLWRIDYILVSGSITPDTCEVPRVDGSDHRPMVADLRLP